MMNKYRFKILIVVQIAILIFLIASRYDITAEVISINNKSNNVLYSTGNTLVEKKDELEISEIIPVQTKSDKDPLKAIYKVSDVKGDIYSLSYVTNKLNVGDKVKFAEYASDQLYLILRNSYPNISLEEMGVDTEEEAYQVTQLAIWEMARRTGEAKYSSELSEINSIRADIGIKNLNHNVFEKAHNLVKYVEAYNFSDEEIKNQINMIPTLIVNNQEISAVTRNFDSIYGPYSYKVETGFVTNVDITVTDWDDNSIDAKIVDKDGKEIKNYISTNEFYVKSSKNNKYLKINIHVDVKRLVALIYEDEYSDYLINGYVKNEMDQPVKIEVVD